MTDYTMRELMDKALEGLSLPAEDITESVLAQAAHRQRRRRSATVLASSAGLATVAGLVAVFGAALPRPADGAATGPGRKSPSPTLTGSAAAHPSPTRTAVDTSAVISGLLPAGSGTVVKMKALPPTPGQPSSYPYAASRFDGTYLIVRKGLTAALFIQSYNPAASPPQRPFGPVAAGQCNDAPPSWNCQVTALPGGVELSVMDEPPGAWTSRTNVGVDAEVSYPDGRTIDIIALQNELGLVRGDGAPGWSEPPVDRAQLAAIVENPVWFR